MTRFHTTLTTLGFLAWLPLAALAGPDPVSVVSFTWQNNTLPNSQTLNVVQGHLTVKNTAHSAVGGVHSWSTSETATAKTWPWSRAWSAT